MPFIPHTEKDIQDMLSSLAVDSVDDLFDEIPKALFCEEISGIPQGMNEFEVGRLLQKKATQNRNGLCFIGAGAYEHHIPAAVWDLASRGEFLTAYTPYQAEASQGTLQTIYEYQTMIASLMGVDVANASLYDGASALAEAVLMAVRVNRKSKSNRILMLGTVHPNYRKTTHSIVTLQNIELIEVPYCQREGYTLEETLQPYVGQDITAIVIQQPNFFGCVEEVDILTDWAHDNNAMVVASVNPMAMTLLKEPGQWGQHGADIVCGEGQPLGVPLAFGGPYFGFMGCKQAHIRQLPGRIVGRTVDQNGQAGFTLTLQAREQHIRRAKATSNICTNQGLLVTAATIYMSLLGFEGMRQVALCSHQHSQTLLKQLTAIKGVTQVFAHPTFHEAVIRLNKPVSDVLELLADRGIQGGYSLKEAYPELGESLLVCVTETKQADDLKFYVDTLTEILQ